MAAFVLFTVFWAWGIVIFLAHESAMMNEAKRRLNGASSGNESKGAIGAEHPYRGEVMGDHPPSGYLSRDERIARLKTLPSEERILEGLALLKEIQCDVANDMQSISDTYAEATSAYADLKKAYDRCERELGRY